MASRKDLVEAAAFARRRLVTAFVSGAPGGHEPEPGRPGRVALGGAALAVLLLLGALVARHVAPRPDVDWTRPGLVAAEEDGALYLVLGSGAGDSGVRPVLNATSARLVLGEAVEPTRLPRAVIDERGPGEPIGILGAPTAPPSADDLLPDGWTVCTSDGSGLRTTLAERPVARPAPGAGVLVTTGSGDLHVIVPAPYDDARAATGGALPQRATVLALPRTTTTDALVDAIGVADRAAEAVRVPPRLLTLFPRGADLAAESLDLPGRGTVPAYVADGRSAGAGLPPDARVGDYYALDGEYSVLTATGPAPLSPFALAVLLNVDRAGPAPRLLDVDHAPPVARQAAPTAATGWPEQLLDPVTGGFCAVLETSASAMPRAVLALGPTEAAAATGLGPDERDVVVEPGHGALVSPGGWSGPGSGAAYLVDDQGRAHELVGDDVAQRLGYADVEAPVVPDAWVELLGAGVPLSVAAALCPPAPPSAAPCS